MDDHLWPSLLASITKRPIRLAGLARFRSLQLIALLKLGPDVRKGHAAIKGDARFLIETAIGQAD